MPQLPSPRPDPDWTRLGVVVGLRHAGPSQVGGWEEGQGVHGLQGGREACWDSSANVLGSSWWCVCYAGWDALALGASSGECLLTDLDIDRSQFFLFIF